MALKIVFVYAHLDVGFKKFYYKVALQLIIFLILLCLVEMNSIDAEYNLDM